jgi:hypothetical protein
LRYFFDTEFLEDGTTIDLLSIGIVAQDGRELYLQSFECELNKASDWVKEHVFPHLEHLHCYGKGADGCDHDKHHPLQPHGSWAYRRQIRDRILAFCDPERYGKPEFWAYYADYDWVAFCQLFGRMIDLPPGYPKYCRDLRQALDAVGMHDIKQPNETPHHALSDARWVRDAAREMIDRVNAEDADWEMP